MIKHDVKKAVCNPYFVVCTIIMALIFIQGSYEDIVYGSDIGVIGALLYSTEFGYVSLVISILASLPFAGSYYEEVHTGYYYHVIGRESRFRYTLGKITAAVTSGFLTVFLAIIIFEIFAVCATPLEVRYGGTSFLEGNSFYLDLIESGYGWVVLLAKSVLYSCYGSVWALVSLVASGFIDNRYVIAVLPFFLERLLMYGLSLVNLDIWHPYNLSLPLKDWVLKQMGGGIPFCLSYFIILCTISFILFRRQMEKQYQGVK